MKIFSENPENKWDKIDECDEIDVEFQKYEQKAKGFDMDEFSQKMRQLLETKENSVEKSMENIKCREVETFSAEETNQWFKENVDPEYNDPYAKGTEVKCIELTEDTTFARVYDGDTNGLGKYGTWMMKAEDIKGLSPEEIRDKFSLPAVPANIVDVEVKAGTKLRMGEAGPVENWGNGGGIQFDTMGKRLGKGCFKNARSLEEEE